MEALILTPGLQQQPGQLARHPNCVASTCTSIAAPSTSASPLSLPAQPSSDQQQQQPGWTEDTDVPKQEANCHTHIRKKESSSSSPRAVSSTASGTACCGTAWAKPLCAQRRGMSLVLCAVRGASSKALLWRLTAM